MAANNKKKKKSNSKNIAIIATCSILALILIIVLCVYLVLKSYIGKINKVDIHIYIYRYIIVIDNNLPHSVSH